MAAAETFSQAVAPADFAAAGLGKLSPAEIARLDALVRAFQVGGRERAGREAGASGASAATAPPPAMVESGAKSAPGLLAMAKVRLAPGTAVEYGTIESRIAGEFRGWENRTVFTLENGQHWQVAGGESYVTPPEPGPAVTIKPGALGSFWMTLAGVRPRVKVVRVDRGP